MRFIGAVAVFALGIGLYAAAALLWDRRVQVVAWWDRRSVAKAGHPVSGAAQGGARPVGAQPGGAAGPGGPQPAGPRPVQATGARNLYLAVALCLLIGTIIVIGSCVGLFAF